jgi:magnesium chelatase subunit D
MVPRQATVVVVDCERGPVRLGLARRVASTLGAGVLSMEDLRAQALTSVVREVAA